MSADLGEITIYYFLELTRHARGGPIRLLLTDAGVPFKEDLISFKDWPAHKEEILSKGISPAGTMPYIKIGDRYMSQMLPILLYLGEKLGYIGNDVEDRYRLSVAGDLLDDFAAALAIARWSKNETEKEDCIKVRRPKLLAALEKVLGWFNSNPFILGDRISTLDIGILTVMQDAELTESERASSPRICKLMEAVAGRDKIKAYLAEKNSK